MSHSARRVVTRRNLATPIVIAITCVASTLVLLAGAAGPSSAAGTVTGSQVCWNSHEVRLVGSGTGYMSGTDYQFFAGSYSETPADKTVANGAFNVVVGPSGSAADTFVVGHSYQWGVSAVMEGLDDAGIFVLKPTPCLRFTASTVAVGSTDKAQVAGFKAGEKVKIWFYGTTLAVGTPVASSTGTATISFIVPRISAGKHLVRAQGLTSGRVTSAYLTVG